MTDTFDGETRRRIMRSVRTSDTEPEQRLEAELKRLGLRFRRNDRGVFGVPDFVFRKDRLAVFVDGDFWHGRDWFENGLAPASNSEFWIAKFERNRMRDRLVDVTLRSSGWSVLRLWGSDVKRSPEACGSKVRARLRRLARTRRSPRKPSAE